MKNQMKTSGLRFLFIVSLALVAVFQGKSQTVNAMSPNGLKAGKDSVSVDKKNLNTTPDQERIYTIVTKMPQFPGGEKELLSYVSSHLKYPLEAHQKGIQGTVLIRFVVNKSGKVVKAEVMRRVEPGIDQEGLRVINSLPDWIPGEMEGEKVSVYYTIPITFKLTGENTASQGLKKLFLYVLDGKVLPADYDISTFTKDNIQSVNVMKADTEEKKAALVAKYGERAANGVIELTSKKQK